MLSPVSLRNYYIIIYYGINLVTPLLLSNYSTVKERGHMFILLEVINVILQKKKILMNLYTMNTCILLLFQN